MHTVLSSTLMLPAVSLPLIASAAALSAALTLVSTWMLDARRCLRLIDMAWIPSMVTSAGVPPAALAIDSLNFVCVSALMNWSTVMGRDTAIFTTCVATVTAVGGGGGGGGGGGACGITGLSGGVELEESPPASDVGRGVVV